MFGILNCCSTQFLCSKNYIWVAVSIVFIYLIWNYPDISPSFTSITFVFLMLTFSPWLSEALFQLLKPLSSCCRKKSLPHFNLVCTASYSAITLLSKISRTIIFRNAHCQLAIKNGSYSTFPGINPHYIPLILIILMIRNIPSSTRSTTSMPL